MPDETVFVRGRTTVTERLSFAPFPSYWTQLSGPSVELFNSDTGRVSFTAPVQPCQITLEWTVLDEAEVEILARDVMTVTVVPGPRTPGFNVQSRFPVTVLGNQTSPSSLAYSESLERAFVIDSTTGEVAAIALEDPALPADLGTLAGPLSQTGEQFGPPTAIAARGPWVAVVYDGVPSSAPGHLVFYDGATLAQEAKFDIDERPTAVEFAPSASRLVVVCAADPQLADVGMGLNEVVDGQGSVTLFRYSDLDPASLNPATDITRIDFSAFDGDRAALLADGVRLPRPTIDVSDDLEPRSIALDSGGTRAWVGLPANGAAAVLNLDGGTVESLRGLNASEFDGTGSPATAKITGRAPWVFRPASGVTLPGGAVEIPDYDVVGFDMVSNDEGQYVFDFVMGRGPASNRSHALEGSSLTLFRPDFEHRLVTVMVNSATGFWQIISERPLLTANGESLSGRPGLKETSAGLAFFDDPAFGPLGTEVATDPNGAILTDVVRVGGEIWCSDSMRPSLLRFTAGGSLIQRYVPIGTNSSGVTIGAETLPAVYAATGRPSGLAQRGGFQGLTVTAGGQIATILHASLDNPDSSNDQQSVESRIVRLLLVNPSNGQPAAEYALVRGPDFERFEDITLIDGELHVVLYGGCSGSRSLMKLDLTGATDLLTAGADVQAGLEAAAPGDLATAFGSPVVPVSMSVVADLSAAGLGDSADFSLVQFDGELLFTTGDRFGYPELNIALGDAIPCASQLQALARPSFGKLTLTPRGIDPSGVDSSTGPRSYPVAGLRQLVDVVAGYQFAPVGSTVYGIDGHLVRELQELGEAATVSKLVLDTIAFPNAAKLQGQEALGTLVVSALDGDADGDDLYESLLAFGGRSLLTFDGDLDVVHDSGDRLDRALRSLSPAIEAKLEAGATQAGAGPAAGAVLGNFRALGVAFRDAGVVGYFDLVSRSSPRLTGFVPTAEGAEPVDIAYFGRLDGASALTEYILVLDAANGTLDVVMWTQ